MVCVRYICKTNNFLHSVSAVEENAHGSEPALSPENKAGRVGICWNIKCKESKECDSFCRDAKYSGGICLPPAKTCCCVY